MAGVKTVLIPKRNEKDLVDVPADVRDQLRIVPVETMDEVLAEALITNARPAARIRAERAERQKTAARRPRRRKGQPEETPIAATPDAPGAQPPAPAGGAV